MTKAETKKRMGATRSPQIKKAKGILFEFKEPNAEFLRGERDKTGKSMVRIVEELLEFRMRYKNWPPERSAK